VDERVDEWREFLVRKIRMLAVGLVSVVLPLSLTTGGLTPLAQAAVPAATPVIATGLVLPADIVYSGDLFLNPVSNARGGSITATFTGAAKIKNRPVYLYKSGDSGVTWARIGSKVKLSSSGTAVFKVAPVDGVQYKAVAPVHTYKVKKKKRIAEAVQTAPVRLTDQWTFQPNLSDEFDGDTLNAAKWRPTLNGENGAGNRWCSVPWDGNATVSGGAAVLKMSRLDPKSELAKQIVNEAKAKQRAAKKKVVGCPNGVFLNARVSNEHTSFKVRTGIVATEVTFPIYQGGHGGVWLRTANNSAGRFDEIDIIEAFGWKKGVQSVLHWGTTCSSSDDRKCETKESAKWVAKKTVGKSSWWGKPHVFSAEFTRTQVIYRIDGAVTRIDKRTMADAEYSIVMSMLSSDYETGRLKKPVKGGKKGAKLPLQTKVNWVRAWTQVG